MPEPSDGATGETTEETEALARELAGLLRGVREVAAEQTWLSEMVRSVSESASDHSATDGGECRVCPVCRGLALVRRYSPEAYDHLDSAVEALTLAARALLSGSSTPSETAPERDAGGPAPRSTGDEHNRPSDRPPGQPPVQWIEIEE